MDLLSRLPTAEDLSVQRKWPEGDGGGGEVKAVARSRFGGVGGHMKEFGFDPKCHRNPPKGSRHRGSVH